ncbi:unnamed protein product, partial [Laminaria digitata]
SGFCKVLYCRGDAPAASTSPIFRREHHGEKPRAPRTWHSHPGHRPLETLSSCWCRAAHSAPQSLIRPPQRQASNLASHSVEVCRKQAHTKKYCSGCHSPYLSPQVNHQGAYLPEPDCCGGLSSPKKHDIVPVKQRRLLDQ